LSEGRLAALTEDIQTRVIDIHQQLDRGELVAGACVMSALPTIQHEIWFAAEELAAAYSDLTIQSVSKILPLDIDPTRVFPAIKQGDHFDYIHAALELSLKQSEL